jgi:GNAT superfamily N-acetyltransferase
MTSITQSATFSLTDQIRLFDPRRDLLPVADLIELCFADTLDDDGQRYLRQMRQAGKNFSLTGLTAFTAEWSGIPSAGFICEDSGTLIGNASLMSFRGRNRRGFLIANVAVHPAYRRQGIGRALTLRAIEYLRQRKIPAVWLHVREENLAAQNMYLSLGFVERARRTAWRSVSEYPRLPLSPDLSISPRATSRWPTQHEWLSQAYPPDFSWHLPLDINALRPGLRAFLYRFFNNYNIQQWEISRDNCLLGVVSRQTTWTSTTALWLAAPKDGDEQAISNLLLYVRRNVPSGRPFSLDYPATWNSQAIQEAGFHNNQTLIWMELSLSG